MLVNAQQIYIRHLASYFNLWLGKLKDTSGNSKIIKAVQSKKNKQDVLVCESDDAVIVVDASTGKLGLPSVRTSLTLRSKPGRAYAVLLEEHGPQWLTCAPCWNQTAEYYCSRTPWHCFRSKCRAKGDTRSAFCTRKGRKSEQRKIYSWAKWNIKLLPFVCFCAVFAYKTRLYSIPVSPFALRFFF